MPDGFSLSQQILGRSFVLLHSRFVVVVLGLSTRVSCGNSQVTEILKMFFLIWSLDGVNKKTTFATKVLQATMESLFEAKMKFMAGGTELRQKKRFVSSWCVSS